MYNEQEIADIMSAADQMIAWNKAVFESDKPEKLEDYL